MSEPKWIHYWIAHNPQFLYDSLQHREDDEAKRLRAFLQSNYMVFHEGDISDLEEVKTYLSS